MERIGVVISFFWLIIVAGLLFFKWNEVTTLSLNEWGDFLAGVTAPLAFLWLIVGYGLQREELKANTAALLFQREEMASQAKELAEQTIHMRENTKAATAQADAVRRKERQERHDRRLAHRTID